MSRLGPRERLLEAARELTYTDGVSVGVDAILERARVARRSLYQHFGGKDQLVAAALHEAAEHDLGMYERFLDSGGDDPRQRIMAIFDGMDMNTSAPGFRGCRFTSAELGLPDPGHPAHAEAHRYRQALHDMLRRELTALGHHDPASAADQLQLLIEGILVMGMFDPGAHPALQAKPLAASVLGPAGAAAVMREPAGPAPSPS